MSFYYSFSIINHLNLNAIVIVATISYLLNPNHAINVATTTVATATSSHSHFEYDACSVACSRWSSNSEYSPKIMLFKLSPCTVVPKSTH